MTKSFSPGPKVSVRKIIVKACPSDQRYTIVPLSFVIVKSKLWPLGKLSVIGWAVLRRRSLAVNSGAAVARLTWGHHVHGVDGVVQRHAEAQFGRGIHRYTPDAGVDQLPRSIGWTSGGLRAKRQSYARQEGLLDDANLKHTGVGNLERGSKRSERTLVRGAAGRDHGDSAAGTGEICGILLSRRRIEGPPEFLHGLARVVLEYGSFGVLAQPVVLLRKPVQQEVGYPLE